MTERELKKIMIVDDDEDLLKLLTFAFKKHPNYEVKYFASSGEAVQEAINDPPDLILLDVMMPQMDGLQVLHTLQGTPKLKNTAIVFFTAKVQESEIKGFLQEGAQGVITKPFDVIKLPQMILDVWQRYISSH